MKVITMLAGGFILKDTRKMGLDPVFGLQATRDSKAMDSARTRNISYDKQLKSFLKSLDEHADTKNVKIITRQARTKEMLDKINPDPDKKIVTPIGLNQEQVKTVRLLRRGSLPSMSLQELDHKLSAIKMERGLTEVKGDAKKPEKPHRRSKCKMTEFKINRQLYRGNSKSEDNKAAVGTHLVDDQSSQFFLPLYRRKSLVCEAYQRITSSDVVYTRKQERDVKKRRQSDSDISVDSSSTNSSGRFPSQNNSHLKPAGPRRWNTMSDIRSDALPPRRVHFSMSKKISDEQRQCNKQEFETFLNTIKQSDKLPALK